MNKTISVPEDLYAELEERTQSHILHNIVALIRELLEQNKAAELQQREAAVRSILELHERMAGKYGLVDDSIELIRQA